MKNNEKELEESYKEKGRFLAKCWADGLIQSLSSQETKNEIIKGGENVAKMVSDTTKKAYKTNSPWKEAMELGKLFSQGLALGMTRGDMLREVETNATMLAKTVTGVVDRLFGEGEVFVSATGIGKQAGDGFVHGLSEAGERAKTAIGTLSDESLALAFEKADSYKAFGSLYVKRMEEGISEGANGLIQAMEQLTEQQLEAQLATLDKKDQEGKKRFKESAQGQMAVYKEAIKKGAAEVKEVLAQRLEGITEEAQRQYDEIHKAQKQMEQKLTSYGSPYGRDEETGKMQLSNIEKEIAALEKYDRLLTDLKEAGASQTLMKEILSMGIDEATEYAVTMLNKGNDYVKERSQDMQSKEELSASIAEKFFAEDKNMIATEFTTQLTEILRDIPKECAQVGEAFVDGIIQGIGNKDSELGQRVREMAEMMLRQFKEATETASPSKRAARELGAPFSQGITKGLWEEYDPKVMAGYAQRMIADVQQEQNRMALQYTAPLYPQTVSNTSYTQGDFVLKVEKMINDGRGSVQSLLQEAEFYRKQKVMAKGGERG